MDDRKVMFGGASALVIGLCIGILLPSYTFMLGLWFFLGAGCSMAQTPSGRILRRSSSSQDRPPSSPPSSRCPRLLVDHLSLAGWLGANVSLQASFIGLSALAATSLVVSFRIWKPEHDRTVIEHTHDNLAEDHEHVAEGKTHSHDYVIDDQHRRWP